jgi:electron transport complex protein RnfB
MLTVNEPRCLGCGYCQPSCPEDAISVWVVAKLNPDKCTNCLACIQWCPVDALEAECETGKG